MVAEDDLRALLATLRGTLGLSLSFVTSILSDRQDILLTNGTMPPGFEAGDSVPLVDTFCRAILAGELPAVISDVQGHPVASQLPGAAIPGLRSFASVPITFTDGTVHGTLCACGLNDDPALQPRDEALMIALARMAAMLLEPQARQRAAREELLERHEQLLASGGPTMVVQPIVDLRDGNRSGFEALARFPQAWHRRPDQAFAEAHRLGLGVDLELAAVRGAAPVLDRTEGYLAVNLSARALLSADFQEVAQNLPLDRVLLELSEHEQVHDYTALHAVLSPLREEGLRLAVDDVGAGYSSLLHIMTLFPDVMKLDRAIVTGLASDPVRRTLVASMRDFSRGCGAQLVAEGVESAEDAAVLVELGVPFGQGYHFGRPGLLAAVADSADHQAV